MKKPLFCRRDCQAIVRCLEWEKRVVESGLRESVPGLPGLRDNCTTPTEGESGVLVVMPGLRSG